MDDTTQTPLPLVDGHLIVDNSSLEHYQLCPRLYQLSDISKRVLASRKAGRNFGSACHVGWRCRYTSASNNAVTPEVVSKINDEVAAYFAANPQPDGDFRTLDHAIRMLAKYNELYKNEPFKIVNTPSGKPIVEASFAFPFGVVAGVPVIYAGRIDLAVEDNEGIWSWDHKTAFQFGDTFLADMAQNGGQRGYVWALRKLLGSDAVKGYCIDAVRVRKPSRKSEYAEGGAPVDETDFNRTKFYVTQDEIDEWIEDTTAIIGRIVQDSHMEYFPRYRKNCVNKFGRCDYYDVCSINRASRDAILASDSFETNTWTPLNKPE